MARYTLAPLDFFPARLLLVTRFPSKCDAWSKKKGAARGGAGNFKKVMSAKHQANDTPSKSQWPFTSCCGAPKFWFQIAVWRGTPCAKERHPFKDASVERWPFVTYPAPQSRSTTEGRSLTGLKRGTSIRWALFGPCIADPSTGVDQWAVALVLLLDKIAPTEGNTFGILVCPVWWPVGGFLFCLPFAFSSFASLALAFLLTLRLTNWPPSLSLLKYLPFLDLPFPCWEITRS